MTKAHAVGRWGLLAALGAAWWIEKLATVEWSYAYCGVLDKGELRPVAVRVLGRPRNCTASPFWFPGQGPRSVSRSEP